MGCWITAHGHRTMAVYRCFYHSDLPRLEDGLQHHSRLRRYITRLDDGRMASGVTLSGRRGWLWEPCRGSRAHGLTRRRSISAALVWPRSRGFALCTEYQTGSMAATRPAQHPCLARQADRCMTACANVSSTPNLGIHGDSWNQSTGWRYIRVPAALLCLSDIATLTQSRASTAEVPCPGPDPLLDQGAVLGFPRRSMGLSQCRTMQSHATNAPTSEQTRKIPEC